MHKRLPSTRVLVVAPANAKGIRTLWIPAVAPSVSLAQYIEQLVRAKAAMWRCGRARAFKPPVHTALKFNTASPIDGRHDGRWHSHT
jgi:hypothetical protein